MKSKKVSLLGNGFSCFSQMRKKGSLETKEIIEIVLAAAGIIVLIILLWSLISPNFNVGDETAKSYLRSFEKTMKEVEKSGTGSFVMWGGEPKMVYFGSGNRISYGKDMFFNANKGDNKVCFCYESKPGAKDWECGACVLLDKPAEFTGLTKVVADAVDHLYFFKGEDYWKYDNYNYYILPEHPKKISVEWTGVPTALDAAVKYSEEVYYFFKGEDYWRYEWDPSKNLNGAQLSKKISVDWSGLPNNLDAVARGLDDDIWFFKGDRYWRYDYGPGTNSLGSLKEGKLISDFWIGIPAGFKPIAATKFKSYIYLFNETDYYKYDLEASRVVANYPKSVDDWSNNFRNLDAVVLGREISYRNQAYANLNVFEEGCGFDIVSTGDKYLFKVRCNLAHVGK